MTEFADNPLDDLVTDDTTSTSAEAVQPDSGQGQPSADPSAVQPEGQGQPDAQTGLYDLSSVPEEYRSHVERIAKDIDRNVNAKLQEAAEYRKSWEPYGELGISDVDPQGLGALLEFAQSLVNPETGEVDPGGARDALLGLASSLGLDLTGEGTDPYDEPDPQDPNDPLRSEFEEFKQSVLEERKQREYLETRQAAIVAYQAEFDEVQGLRGSPFSPEEKADLVAMAKRFQADHDEPIKAAYQWMQQIRGQAEAALVNSQPAPPAQAERGGRASSTVQPVDSFEEAERLHRERNASAHA